MARPKTELDALLADHDPDAWRMAGDWCEERGMDAEAKRCRLMVELADRMYPLVRRAAMSSTPKAYRYRIDLGGGFLVWVKLTAKCVAVHLTQTRGKELWVFSKCLLPIQTVMPIPFTDRFEEAGLARLHACVCKLTDAILAREVKRYWGRNNTS